MKSRPRLDATQRLLTAALLAALLLTQALGLVHRVLHAHGPASPLHAELASAAAAQPPPALERLFAQHHDAQECQVFDQLTQADAPGFAFVCGAHEAAAEPGVAVDAVPRLAAQAAGYLARGPPLAA